MKKETLKTITIKGNKYYINNNGVIVTYQNGKIIPIKEYILKGQRYVRIGKKYYSIKSLVYKTFVDVDFVIGNPILHKDKNSKNCNYKNLTATNLHELGKIYGQKSRHKPLIAITPSGYAISFNSITEAAERFNVSQWCIRARMQNKGNKLRGFTIKEATK